MERRRIGQGIAVTLVGAAAGGLAWGWRRHGRRTSDGAAAATGADGPFEPYVCDCGQRFRVVGMDRHRVYWLDDAPDSDPVLTPACPNCERPLPA